MTRQFAYLAITGTGPLRVITEAMGIEPSSGHASADVNPKSGRQWGLTYWQLGSHIGDDRPLVEHIEALLLWLSRRQGAVNQLAADFDLTIQCVCHADNTFGFHLNREIIRQLGQLHVALDYDAYAMQSNEQSSQTGESPAV